MTPTPVLTIKSSYYVHFYGGNLPYLDVPEDLDSVHIGLADKGLDCYGCNCEDCPLNDEGLPCESMAFKLLDEAHPDIESTNPEYFL